MVSFLRKFKESFLILLAVASHGRAADVTDNSTIPIPTRFGLVLFPGFEMIDVFGPLDALNLISWTHTIDLFVIADTLEPIANNGITWAPVTNAANSSFGITFNPTHTFQTAPPLDVLIIPGGIGTRAPARLMNSTIEFVKERFPSLQYLFTVCTGSGIAARAGVLDGIHATTNKHSWAQTIALGPKVKWVAEARWVQDGNIWTSSGVSAGTDMMIAFISYLWGNATAQDTADVMEYNPITVSTYDPFAKLYNLTDANNSTNQD